MANLTESPIYEPGIFQLEKTTPPLGGAPAFNGSNPSTGHANAQALQLANRTAWLKQQLEARASFSNYTTLRAYTGTATNSNILANRIQGEFYLDTSDTTSSDNGGTIIVDANGGRWKRKWNGEILTDWFLLDNTGSTSSSSQLELIAQFSKTVTPGLSGSPYIRFGGGTYLHDVKTTTAANWIVPSNTFLIGSPLNYLAPGSALLFDTSNLTGTVKRDFPATSRLAQTVGDPTFGVQRFIGTKKPDGFGTLFSAKIHASSNTATGGIYGSSQSSARDGSDLSTIGVTAVVVNDNKNTPKPGWGVYIEAHRDINSGNLHCIESTSMNYGALRRDTPYGSRDLYTSNGDSYNILINTGGSLTDPVNNTTAAIGIAPKAKGKFDRGIIFKSGSVDSNEALSLPDSYELSWYSQSSTGNEFKSASIKTTTISDSPRIVFNVQTSTGESYPINLSKTGFTPSENFVTDLGTDALRFKTIYSQSLHLNPTNSMQWTNAARLVGQVGQLILSAYQTSSSSYATNVLITPSEMSPSNNLISLGTSTRQWSDIRASMATYSGPVRPGQYTLATLPSASAFNAYEICVTDATGGPKKCRSNGSVWQILNTTTTVS